jgi:hypothetical protein
MEMQSGKVGCDGKDLGPGKAWTIRGNSQSHFLLTAKICLPRNPPIGRQKTDDTFMRHICVTFQSVAT